MSWAKGKFINAFSSIQMLGDYDENDSDSKENLFASNGAASDPAENSHLENIEQQGNELYNPLEDMDIENDEEEKEMGVACSPPTKSIMKIDSEKDVSEPSELGRNDDTIFHDENTRDESIKNFKEDEDDASSEQEKKIIEELENIQHHSDLNSNHLDFLDDQDELLGTALAELEEEEKERQKELEALKLQAGQSSDEGSGKKKKKKKEERKSKDIDKHDEDDEKNSKKKKRKKKKKKKARDSGEGKKKKKSKEKKEKESELGIDEILERIKEEERKEKSKKQELKTSKSSKKEINSHEKSLSKEKRKDETSHKSREKERRNSDRKRSLSVDRKHDSKSNRDQSSRSRRSSKDSEPSKKRSRKEGSPDKKHGYKYEGREPDKKRSADKEYDRKKSSKKEGSEERELRRKHDDRKVSPPRKEKKLTHDNKVDYEIKMPDQKKKESPPKLSKDEFYKLQHEARNIDDKHEHKRKHSKDTSSSPSSESNKEINKSLHRSSLHENFSSELRKFREEHKHEIIEKDTKNNDGTSNDRRKDRNRRSSGSKTLSRQISHSPEKTYDQERNRTVSENSKHSNGDFSLIKSNDQAKNEHDDELYEFGPEVNHNLFNDKLSSKNDDSPSESLHIYSVSSHSDTENSLGMTDDQLNLKPGSLSLRQYKERRKSHRLSGNDHHSSVLRDDVYHKKDTKSPDDTNEALHFDRENKENMPGKSDVHNNSSNYSVDIEREDNHSDNTSIPLLFDGTSNEKLHSSINHNHSTASHGQESPYNPEASPLDMASPSLAAVDDGGSVDFTAFKDNVAFEDIMKSKVKHEARKHRRRKLEELKAEFGSPPLDSKEGKLIDYLVRQAQVEEHMKTVLKQYFKTREITKEEYKNILKKAVPQVTMSNSPIIPEKIESLMTKFVRKCKGHRAKEQKMRRKEQKELAEQQKQLQLQLQTSAAMFQQIRVLNPNLPMPPV